MIILLNEIHLSRFWPQFEAFLAFQVVKVDGLVPGRKYDPEYMRHYLLAGDKCLSDVKRNELSLRLESRWQMASVDDAKDVLALPTLNVTSGKDKIQQISKLMELQQDLAL